MHNLYIDFERVIKTEDIRYDDIIIGYFNTVAYDGAYLIAETYVNMIAGTAVNGVIPLPDAFEDCIAKDRITIALNEINSDATNNGQDAIYDSIDDEIRINDTSNLSDLEECAILATHTANICFNSFAAEVQYHAERAIQYYGSLFDELVYERAVRAGMGIDEAGEFYDEYMPYYDSESEYWKAQVAAHGVK